MVDHLHRADVLVGRFVDHVRDHDPVQATRLGLSDRDGELPDLSSSALAARSRDLAVLVAEVDAALSEVPGNPTGDDREARDDLRLLEQELAYRGFVLDERPRYVLDPLAVLDTTATGVHELLRIDDGTHEDRCRRIQAAVQRARRVPFLLEQAGRLLVSAAAPNLELAVRRLPGLIALFTDELPRRADALGLDTSTARDAGEVAAEGLDAYGALLLELSEEPAADWRLGPNDHARTLRAGIGTTIPAQDIEDRARTWLARIVEEMAELAARSWSRRFPGERVPTDTTERIVRSLDRVADTALGPEQLVAEARAAIRETYAFSHELVDVPPTDRLQVTDVPPYLRGIAVAFVVPAPPLRPDVGCTLHLSPAPDAGGDAGSFLREYHPAQLRSVALHEGYPGHVVQLEHAARHPRLARRLLARPVFAEGWAVAIEREALAAGFGDDATSQVDGDDYRITQRKLELRLATDALLDVGLHAGNLDDDDALRLLTSVGLQQPAEARGLLARAKVSSGQLCAYFVGGEELADLKLERQRAEGDAFDLRRFHQQLLSHGTPTVDIVASALRDGAEVHRPFASGG